MDQYTVPIVQEYVVLDDGCLLTNLILLLLPVWCRQDATVLIPVHHHCNIVQVANEAIVRELGDG